MSDVPFLVALLAVTVGIGACGDARSLTPAASRAEAKERAGRGESKALTRRAKLRYEIRGRSFPLPLVTGTIAGQPVLMLVDTGANSHVIAGWLARKLALPMKKLGDVGSDHTGRSIATYRIDKPWIAIDEWGPLSADTVLAIEVPEAFERLGIGAFISPQRLEEEGDATIVDLVNGELRSAWWTSAKGELEREGNALVTSDQGRTCEETDGPVRGLAFVVPATVDSHQVQLLVDTGAQQSDVFATSTAGRKLVTEGTTSSEPLYTISGKIPSSVRKSAQITSGAFTTSGDVALIQGAPDSGCPRDGVLAMDVLRSCTLLLGRSQLYARCLPPK